MPEPEEWFNLAPVSASEAVSALKYCKVRALMGNGIVLNGAALNHALLVKGTYLTSGKKLNAAAAVGEVVLGTSKPDVRAVFATLSPNPTSGWSPGSLKQGFVVYVGYNFLFQVAPHKEMLSFSLNAGSAKSVLTPFSLPTEPGIFINYLLTFSFDIRDGIRGTHFRYF